MNWNEYYINLARTAAGKSKDPSTKCGAVIVGEEVRSMGFNGLPRGCQDDLPEREERPEKYFWYEHAERNAIYNAARAGIPTKGCTIYITGPPCMDCSRGIVQAGIDYVVIDKSGMSDEFLNRWGESFKKSLHLFQETSVGFQIFPDAFGIDLYGLLKNDFTLDRKFLNLGNIITTDINFFQALL